MTQPDHRSIYIDLLKRSLTGSLYEQSSWEIIESTRGVKERYAFPIRRFVKSLYRQAEVTYVKNRGFLLVRPKPYDASLRNEGMDWPLIGYTMIGEKRLDNLQLCVEDVLKRGVPGDFIETGVWRGGATILMRALLKLHGDTTRTVWVADSFEGLPPSKSKADGYDISHIEFLKVSLEKVQSHFERFGLLDNQVRFLKGWFADTLPTAPIEKLAILRLDGDLYSSTMDALNALYDKVSPGGYVIVDDYHTWKSCREAVTDFCKARGLTPDIQRIDHSGAFWQVATKIP
jgi:Macrocin-O-methyltransferase (TylF)